MRVVRLRPFAGRATVRVAVRLPPTLRSGTYEPAVTVVVGTEMATRVVDAAAGDTAVRVR